MWAPEKAQSNQRENWNRKVGGRRVDRCGVGLGGAADVEGEDWTGVWDARVTD